jgi:hypothetical protein
MLRIVMVFSFSRRAISGWHDHTDCPAEGTSEIQRFQSLDMICRASSWFVVLNFGAGLSREQFNVESGGAQ